MCERWGVKTNVDLEHEKMIRSVMIAEDQWFVCSASSTPELLNQSVKKAWRIYEDEGLHGMDMKRYVAFCAHYRQLNGTWPDDTYWCFLLSGSYDRSEKGQQAPEAVPWPAVVACVVKGCVEA